MIDPMKLLAQHYDRAVVMSGGASLFRIERPLTAKSGSIAATPRQLAAHARALEACRLFYDGASTRDIADHMGVSPQAVRSILNRAGKSVRGRDAVRARIREHVAQGAAA